MSDPREPPVDIALMAERLRIPAEEWKGRCYEIASYVRGVYDLDARLCYGHWLGPVAQGSHFGDRAFLPFQRHGWLELPDGRIYDPTRWVFEAVEPYVYVGRNDHYDEGGDFWREATGDLRPVPGDDAHPRKVPLNLPPEEGDARLFIAGIFGRRPEDLNLLQVGYLANLSRKRLGEHAGPIFKAIVAAGLAEFIPLDNRKKVLGECRDEAKGPGRKKLFDEHSDGPYGDKR